MSKQLRPNVVLHYAELYNKTHDKHGNVIPIEYSLLFHFYGKPYELRVPVKSVEEDNSFAIYLDGDSDLFHSFNNLCEDELWEAIKAEVLEAKEIDSRRNDCEDNSELL